MWFFKKGKQYRVITWRPDTHHTNHWFPTGTIVTCVEVCSAYSKKSSQFNRDHLTGEFIDAEGITQTLSTGDVVAI